MSETCHRFHELNLTAMDAEPIRSAPSPASGGGPRKNDEVKEGEKSPLMKLGMGIDSGFDAAMIKQAKPLLTAAQLDELHSQVVIYKYIAAGLPVPSSLVRPIWKSVSDSLRLPNGASGMHRQYPSFVGFSKELDYISMTDPEPERCRRTDGKRWRCRKHVIPGQKYCEQHMHRGCRRSRKPVESFQTIINTIATPQNNYNSSENLENSNAKSFSSAPATIPSDAATSHKNSGTVISNVDFKIMGTNMTLSVATGSKTISTSMIPKGTASCIAAIATPHTVASDSNITTATMGTNKGNDNNDKSNCYDDRNRNSSNYFSLKNQIDRGKNSTSIKNAKNTTSQRLNFSPKSVLQVQHCSTTQLCRSEGEFELRCRRTDGKKWRCRRDVLPNEKYCKMHMHRGAKKRVLDCQSPALLKVAPDTFANSNLNPTSDSSDLNTNLSISISANPQLQTRDGMKTSDTSISTSSDTTISDTVIATCDVRDISS